MIYYLMDWAGDRLLDFPVQLWVNEILEDL